MTKDEDDWLSDFLEVAQASARQGQTAAEKDYAAKLKWLTPRFEQAQPHDAAEELAQRIAASEALAEEKKFDAASDTLDEAFLLASGLIAAAFVPEIVDAEPLETAPEEPVEGAEIVVAEEGAIESTEGMEPAAGMAEGEEVAPEELPLEETSEPPPEAAPEDTETVSEEAPSEEGDTEETSDGGPPLPGAFSFSMGTPPAETEELAEDAPPSEDPLQPEESAPETAVEDAEAAATEETPSDEVTAESAGEESADESDPPAP